MKNKFKKNIFILVILLIILMICVYKIYKSGNTIIKLKNNLVVDIFNISSYEAKIEVTISSNKTENKYILKQYYESNKKEMQIVEYPENIKGLEINYNNENLEIKNSKIGLTKIYNNYSYINNNILWLNYFIEKCKENKYELEETENEIIILLKFNQNRYYGKLYLNKTNNKPIKMEIKDNSNKSKIYIEYIEISLK